MIKFFVVFIGGGLGSIFRYWISSYASKHLPLFFPFGTLLVNILGSFILGLMIFGWDEKGLISPTIKLFIGVGFCGGLTTFSTFSLETFNLIRGAEFLLAGINVLVNVLFTLVGIYIAYLVTR
ncbi:MAG: fluoride efflux transporter CrcB [Bacteroidetes bacterium]|nr:fluoride efflux transporter CrcB [Bacteroidota bacterium]